MIKHSGCYFLFKFHLALRTTSATRPRSGAPKGPRCPKPSPKRPCPTSSASFMLTAIARSSSPRSLVSSGAARRAGRRRAQQHPSQQRVGGRTHPPPTVGVATRYPSGKLWTRYRWVDLDLSLPILEAPATAAANLKIVKIYN